MEEGEQTPYVFDTPEKQSYATLTYQVIRQMERELPNIAQLGTPEVRAKIADMVTASVVNNTIAIPEIVVLPTGDVTFGFGDFDLADLDTIASQPLFDEIVVQQMRTGQRLTIARNMAVVREERMEDYLVVHLFDFDEVDYDADADLLYKLAGQSVARLQS